MISTQCAPQCSRRKIGTYHHGNRTASCCCLHFRWNSNLDTQSCIKGHFWTLFRFENLTVTKIGPGLERNVVFLIEDINMYIKSILLWVQSLEVLLKIIHRLLFNLSNYLIHTFHLKKKYIYIYELFLVIEQRTLNVEVA